MKSHQPTKMYTKENRSPRRRPTGRFEGSLRQAQGERNNPSTQPFGLLSGRTGKIASFHNGLIALKSSLLSLLGFSFALLAIDNPHFWRATNFLPQFYEPRLERSWLSSLDVAFGTGATKQARNGMGNKVPLGDIYGTYNMRLLGQNVPGKNLALLEDALLMQLSAIPANDGFGQLSFNAKFKIKEINFSFTQNINCGFFVQAHLPVRWINISEIAHTDLSPATSTTGADQSNPIWQSFLINFSAILKKYNLSIAPIAKRGVGDLSILFGWTNNYEDTQEIDYFDTTFRAGVLIPTGQKKNENLVFDIANGYNGHFAIPVSFDFAVGWYDWLTIGAHFGAMTFFQKTHTLRLKTDCAQSGLIALAQGKAHLTPGTLWELNAYVKADHMVCGLSLLLGYSFANKSADSVQALDQTIFTPSILASDEQFLGWKMHTLQFLADWDFASYEHPCYPHIGGFYNFIVGGKRIFNTNMIGFEAGVHCGWVF